MDTLISNATIVTMDERMQVIFGGCIGVTDGKIAYIGKTPPKQTPAVIIDGAGMVAMPGLINCHTHLATTALRSFVDDRSDREALEALLQKEARMDSRCAKAAALLGIAECLRFGVTSVSDLYYYPEATAEAAAQSGIKANVALSAYRFQDESEDFDFETDEQCALLRRVKEKWHGFDGGRIRVDAGIYAEYTSNYKLWEALSAYAREEKLGFQLHLSQTRQEVDDCLARTGLTPAQLLDCHGVFDTGATVAGGAFLTDEEKHLLGKRKASVAVTPAECAKAGRPSADLVGCVRAGMNAALGSGGAVECGSADPFELMRLAAAAARQAGGDASAFPATAALMTATVCGARAQGRSASCGMLKQGLDADIVLVDFTAPHLMPCHNVLSALVFAAKGSDVAMTMVRGKILYQSGKFKTIDLGAVVRELTQYAIPKLFEEK